MRPVYMLIIISAWITTWLTRKMEKPKNKKG